MITTEIRPNATGAITMKAVFQGAYGSADVLQLREVDKPTMGANEVLVRVRAAGVNVADWAIMCGLPYIARPMYGMGKPQNPIRGTDVAGEVEAVGASVTRFRPGDQVFGWSGHLGGAFAEYVSVSEAALVSKPSQVTFEQAAAVPMAGSVALLAIRGGKVQGGQRILVNGASGGIGILAVQIAKSLGAHVTGVTSTKNVDLVQSIGADEVIDYTKVDFTRTGQRYDFILDNVANRTLSDLRRALTLQGTLVPNGGGFEHRWVASGGRLIGAKVSFAFGTQKVLTFIASPKQENLVALREFLQAGTVTPVIDRTYSLNKTAAAIRYVGQGHARGKVIISV